MVPVARRLVSLLASFVVLAGCVQGGEPADVQAPTAATFNDETGAIAGRVLDEEFTPVAGASVGLLELSLTTTTDNDGRFSFSDVLPGDYTLAVARIGYESKGQYVSVAAGKQVDVELTLVRLATEQPFQRVWTDKGFFECSLRTPISAGPCFFPGPQIPAPNNKRAWNYVVGPGIMAVTNELQWDQNSLATGSEMRVTFSYANRTTSHWYCDAEGPSPLKLHWDRETECVSGDDQLPEDEPETIPEEGQELRSFVNSGRANPPVGVTGTGIMFQQSFEIWVTEFYHAPAPENYTALP